jgi:transcriptional regulator with XRE-family HTH domain
MQVDQELKALRDKAKLTQEQIGVAINRSQSQVSYLMKRKAKNPRPSADVVAGIEALKALHADALADN